MVVLNDLHEWIGEEKKKISTSQNLGRFIIGAQHPCLNYISSITAT